MPPIKVRTLSLFCVTCLAMSACGGSSGVPPNQSGSNSAPSIASRSPDGPSAVDTTSILKLLTKDVQIGSTVDPTNGDTGPRAVSVAPGSGGKIKKGDLLVCNFDNASGTAGDGTTIEVLPNAPSSAPSTFLKGSEIQGCDGDAIASGDEVYATGLTSKMMVNVTDRGVVKKSYDAPITDPLADGAAARLYEYAPEYIFVANADTGAIDSIGLGRYGKQKLLEVVNGFPVNKGSGWNALGPSGLAYNSNKKVDTLYVVDGACNAVVAIDHASSLLEKDEITVEAGCKTFKCPDKKFTCGKLVLKGKPLDAPEAEAILPNGNLIVANTKRGNTLVEMTPSGQVLDTKVVDKSKTAGIYGLVATGSNDSNTVIYYTDTNTNTLQELEE